MKLPFALKSSAQARFGTELDAVETRVVEIDTHENRTRSGGDEHQAVGVLRNDLLAA